MAKPIPQFNLTFPCYVIVAPDCHSAVLVPIQDGTIGLLIFADETLLRGFIRQYRLEGPLLRFDRPIQRVRFLDVLPKTVTHAVFDAEFAAHCCPLATLRADLEKAAAGVPHDEAR